MIKGHGTFPLGGAFRPGVFVGDGRFRPNGSSAPTVLEGSLQGLYTVAYAATGKLTVTLSPGLSFPRQPTILLTSTCKDITDTNRFDVRLLGDWDNANRKFVVQCMQTALTVAASGNAESLTVSGAFEVPSDADNWISFGLYVPTKTAK